MDMDLLLATIILFILGIVLIVLMLKEGTRYWQWMPMHSLWYKITKRNRTVNGKLKVRLYDERADLYQCPTCKHYLGIDQYRCLHCGQCVVKSFWV